MGIINYNVHALIILDYPLLIGCMKSLMETTSLNKQ